MATGFTLVLFSTRPEFILPAVKAGIGAVLVDWENRGKEQRQASADTQINYDTIEDLRGVAAGTDVPVICRINRREAATDQEAGRAAGPGLDTRPLPVEEIEQAIEAGADEVLLPMVRRVEEVELALDQAGGRCGVGIMIETMAAVERAEELARLPLARAYVGLNDLAIERNSQNIFIPLVDGLLEHVRRPFRLPFGFGGLTLPDRGFPVPCRLLIGEMARLDCDFSCVRRSFHADVRGRDLAAEVPRIHDALDRAFRRPPDAIARDRDELRAAVMSWTPARSPSRTSPPASMLTGVVQPRHRIDPDRAAAPGSDRPGKP